MIIDLIGPLTTVIINVYVCGQEVSQAKMGLIVAVYCALILLDIKNIIKNGKQILLIDMGINFK